jgi:hypothetical protein
MTPPPNSSRPAKPRPASPQERGAEFAEAQRQLKAEAAERREKAAQDAPTGPAARRPGRRRG